VDDASLVRNMQLEVQKRLHEQLEVQSLFRAASIDLLSSSRCQLFRCACLCARGVPEDNRSVCQLNL
jgi:hypothetical protein